MAQSHIHILELADLWSEEAAEMDKLDIAISENSILSQKIAEQGKAGNQEAYWKPVVSITISPSWWLATKV